jgi:DNA-binding NtrC family response regulator
LQERITDGRFREDLYYRLNGISVIVPPLRERPDDVEPLALHFAAMYAKKGRPVPTFSPESLQWLESYPWPGNVRELRNVIERAVILCDDPVLAPHHLPMAPHSPAGPASRIERRTSDAAGAGLRDEVKTLEKERIESALAASQGNQRRAAEKLGISRGALLRRMDQLGLARPRKGG